MFIVALFMRAWIEIYSFIPKFYVFFVALFMRAWIEIRYGSKKDISKPSPSS